MIGIVHGIAGLIGSQCMKDGGRCFGRKDQPFQTGPHVHGFWHDTLKKIHAGCNEVIYPAPEKHMQYQRQRCGKSQRKTSGA
jgi:hypothetical protein